MDAVGFEAIWNNIKEKYISEVRTFIHVHSLHEKVSAPLNVPCSWQQAATDSAAPVETPQAEIREPVSDNDSDQYPEDDTPEDEDDDDEDEDEEPDDGDYKVNPQIFSCKLMLGDSSLF